MAEAYKWAEALNINSKSLKEWSALAPDDVPLIVWLLQEGHVDCGAYLRWASAEYGLPIVNPAYFSEAFDVAEARELHSNPSLQWTAWLLPIEQWDGLTLVGCVEPPTGTSVANIQFVLADPRVLSEAWSQMVHAVSDAAQEPAQEPKTDFAPPPVPDAPVGISEGTGLKPFTLNLDLNNTNLFGPPAIPEPEPEPVAEIAEEPEAPPVTIEAKPSNPEPPTPVATPAATAVATAGATHSATETTGLHEPLLNEVLAGLAEHYQHAFIMRCVNGVARLHKWDKSMNPKDGGKNIQVDLAFPTFFRIVSKTGMPYHGYLVDSPAHRDFFNDLKIQTLPGCVTAVPIKEGSTIVGVLVATGDESQQKIESLAKVEEAAARLAQALAPAWAEAA